MGDLVPLIVLLSVLFLLLGTGIWIGLSMLGVALVGMTLFTARPVGDAMMTTIWGTSSSWTLTALPMFIWMGEILYRTKISHELFRGMAPWLQWLPGRLLHCNVGGCAVFAAVSGSSTATLVAVGKITMPELLRRNYPEHLVIGTLAGASTLGLLIPPSIVMIVYGVIVNESIAKLFIAGILPGLMLACLFSIYIVLRALLKPGNMPPRDPPIPFLDKLVGSLGVIPVVLLVLAVLGSIYTGVATATEAAMIGVIGSLLLSAVERTLSWQSFIDALLASTRTSCMIALILAGAAFLSLTMGYTGLPRQLARWIASLHLSTEMLILSLAIFYIILGCFLDGISAIVLTMGVVEPMLRTQGIDILWFGIFIVILVEMAQITPPVGFNLFVLQNMTNRSIGYIARTALPMFFVMCLALAIITVFPGIVTFLPNQMTTVQSK